MEKITIGVYHAFRPRTAQDDERMEAMIKESKNQNIELIFYNNEGISLGNKAVNGYIYEYGNWKKIRSLIPEVTINLLSVDNKNKTSTEIRLSELTEFTSTLVLNKYEVYKKLIKSKKYKKYAIESILVEDYRDILEFIDKYENVVFKPVGGRQGFGIYFIYKKEEDFIIIKDQKKESMNLEKFKKFIDDIISKESYLVQQYVRCVTKNNEPYDFRVHVHRDSEGKFKVIFLHPRVGNKNGILTSLSQGGKMPNIDSFLINEFENNWKEVKINLKSIALELSEYIQSFSNKEINEIGVDLAIDENGNYYTYELNGAPNSRYHQDIRMKYVMEYARYRYEMYITGNLERDLKYTGGQFLNLEKKLMLGDLEDDIYIGILSYPNNNHESIFNEAASYIALEKDINLFIFYPSSIDKYDKSILGRYYENGKYKVKKFAYPDLVIDRLGLRARESSQELYEELADLDFDHRIDNLEDLRPEKLIRDKELAQYLVEGQKIGNLKEIFDFLDRQGALVLEGIRESLNYKIYIIKNGDKYEFLDMKDRDLLTREDLETKIAEELESTSHNYVKELETSSYRSGKNYSIVINMVRGYGGEWKISRRSAKIGGKNQKVLEARYGSHIGDLREILDYKFGTNSEQVYKTLGRLSYDLSQEIDRNLEGRISEASYELILSDQGNISIVDMDLLTPDIKFIEYQTARELLSYGQYLLEKNK